MNRHPSLSSCIKDSFNKFYSYSYRDKIFIFLFFSAFLGVGLSYGKLYLVHIALLVGGIAVLPDLKKLFSAAITEKHHWFFIFMPLYYALGLTWSDDFSVGLAYVAQATMGCVLALLICHFYQFQTVYESWAKALLTFFIYFIAAIETIFHVHYPISKYSQYSYYFRKSQEDTDIQSVFPSSVFWSASNLSFVLIVALPFLLYRRSMAQQFLIFFISFLLLIRTSSRLGLILLSLYFLVIVCRKLLARSFPLKQIFLGLTLTALLSFFSLSMVLPTSSSNDFRNFSQDVVRQIYTYRTLLSSEENIDPSRLSRREKVLVGAFQLWKKNPVFGSGPGQLYNIQFDSVSAATPHLYWLELMAHGGLLLFLAFSFWFYNLWLFIKSTVLKDMMVLYFVAAPIIPSLVYFFPSWLFLGLIASMASRPRVDT